MKPRSLFLALIAAWLAAPSFAAAQETYFGLGIGYNSVTDGDQDFPPAASTSYEMRPSFAVTYGYKGNDGLRLEGELGWRANDVDTVSGTAVTGRLTALSLMLNILYEGEIGGGRRRYGLRSGSGMRPYMGFGIGGGMFSLDYATTPGGAKTVDDEAFAMSWQGILGVGFNVGDNSMLSVDYRYFVAENVDMSTTTPANFEIDMVQSTVMLSLRTSF